MEEQVSGRQYGLKYGLILGLVGTAVFVVPALLRLTLSIQFLFYWVYWITIFYFALKEFRTEKGGFMSFGEGFKVAMLIALVGGVVRSILRYVFLVFDPEYFEFAQQAQQDNPFAAQPDNGQDISGIMEAMFTPESFAILSFVGAIFAGLIFGAIMSAVMKNEAEEF